MLAQMSDVTFDSFAKDHMLQTVTCDSVALRQQARINRNMWQIRQNWYFTKRIMWELLFEPATSTNSNNAKDNVTDNAKEDVKDNVWGKAVTCYDNVKAKK